MTYNTVKRDGIHYVVISPKIENKGLGIQELLALSKALIFVIAVWGLACFYCSAFGG